MHRIDPRLSLVFVMLWGAGCSGPDHRGASGDPLAGFNVLAASEIPWESLDTGWRRKVLFSGELTFVVIDVPAPSDGPITLHRHVNDQISYVVDGEIEVRVGDEVKKIGSGGFYRIPCDELHGIRVLSPTARLVDAFTPPREDFRK